MKTYFLYKITNNINGKVYIGITSKKVKVRFCQHKSKARTFSKLALHKAINNYGENNFMCETLLSGLNESDAFNAEMRYIKKYNSFGKDGYNMTVGGDGTKGHVTPDYVKLALSKRCKGVPLTESHKRNLSKSLTGVKKTISDKTIRAWDKRKGTKQSDDIAKKSRANLDKAKDVWTGCHHSEESKAKMTQAKSRNIILTYPCGKTETVKSTLRTLAKKFDISATSLVRSIKKNRCVKKKGNALFGVKISYA